MTLAIWSLSSTFMSSFPMLSIKGVPISGNSANYSCLQTPDEEFNQLFTDRSGFIWYNSHHNLDTHVWDTQYLYPQSHQWVKVLYFTLKIFRNISNSRDETQSLFSYYYEQVFPYIIPFVFPVSTRSIILINIFVFCHFFCLRCPKWQSGVVRSLYYKVWAATRPLLSHK